MSKSVLVIPEKFYTGIYSNDPYFSGVREWKLEQLIWEDGEVKHLIGIACVDGLEVRISYERDVTVEPFWSFFRDDAQKHWVKEMFMRCSWEEKVEYAKQHGLPEVVYGPKV